MIKTKLNAYLVKIAETALSNILTSTRRFDVEALSHLLAAVESARLRLDCMPAAKNLVTRWNLLDFALEQVSLAGMWLEFGVYRGKSIRRIAARAPSTVYGFDSFEGLPEDWILSYRRGDFSRSGELPPHLPSNVEIVKGRFSESLPPFLETHPGPAAFLHVDCDLYRSTRTVLSALGERIVAGTIILFDEFFNFPHWQQHEFKAFTEFVDAQRCGFEYIGFASAYNSVAVRMSGAGDGKGQETAP